MGGKCKHSSLTGYFKRKADSEYLIGSALERLLEECEVDETVGCLPPELLKQINYKNVAQVTSEFKCFLSKFVEQHFFDLVFSSFGYWSKLDALTKLFGTTCEIEADGTAVGEAGLGRGSFGVICKLSFPKLNVKYALKIYYNQSNKNLFDKCIGNGKNYEIPVAFAAVRAEPKQNNICYIASLSGNGYLLSKWQDCENKSVLENNQNQIFCTSKEERKPKNYRNGKRIDFGETFKTPYGCADYEVRKLYRKFLNKSDEINSALNTSNYLQKQKIKSAINLIQQMAEFNQKMR